MASRNIEEKVDHIKEPYEFSRHEFEARSVKKVVCVSSVMSSSIVAGTEKVES